MRISIEPGAVAWADAGPLLSLIWPSDANPRAPWFHIETEFPTRRVMIRDEAGELVCHVGMQERDALWNGDKVRIGGIGGVATRENARGRGLASRALQTAIDIWREESGADLALLFTEPHNFDFYDNRGWHRFEGDVFVDQPGGRIKHTVVTPFVYDLALAPREGVIDLCGKPW